MIVGSYEDLERAVKKKPIMRQTSLAEKVRKMVCGLASKKAESEKENIDSDNGKEEVKSVGDDETPMSPRKLSQMFEDSMRDWRSQEEVLAEVFQSVSPGKRKSHHTVCRPKLDPKVCVRRNY